MTDHIPDATKKVCGNCAEWCGHGDTVDAGEYACCVDIRDAPLPSVLSNGLPAYGMLGTYDADHQCHRPDDWRKR